MLFAADVTHEDIAEIVRITREHENDDRLHWNVYKLPHHCSYLAVGPEKGNDKTIPTTEVEWLCETQGEAHGYIISPSWPIPAKGSKEDRDVQPPHRQAAEYYRTDVLAEARNLLVTMAEPTSFGTKPIEIAINGDGAVKIPAGASSGSKQGGVIGAASVTAPRAG